MQLSFHRYCWCLSYMQTCCTNISCNISVASAERETFTSVSQLNLKVSTFGSFVFLFEPQFSATWVFQNIIRCTEGTIMRWCIWTLKAEFKGFIVKAFCHVDYSPPRAYNVTISILMEVTTSTFILCSENPDACFSPKHSNIFVWLCSLS